MNVKGLIVASSFLASMSLGILVEANIRYLPEWPGPPEEFPLSLTITTLIASMLGLIWSLAMVYYSSNGSRGAYRLTVGLMGSMGILWSLWLVYLGLYSLDVVSGSLQEYIPPLGIPALPLLIVWLYSSVILYGRVYTLPIALLVITGSIIGLLGVFLGVPLALTGLVDEWDRIAGKSIIMVWASALLLLKPAFLMIKVLTQRSVKAKSNTEIR